MQDQTRYVKKVICITNNFILLCYNNLHDKNLKIHSVSNVNNTHVCIIHV
jgi:hypothetical protein